MSQEELEVKASIWCQPISESAFCGQPSRYEDDYELLLTELGKLESIHGEECDWQEIRRAADALTREKSKDMQVLGALCAAELRISGPSALAPALLAYRLLMEQHSKVMFPNAARRRGRAGAYGWMVKSLHAHLEGFMPLPEDSEGLEACLEQFKALDELLRAELQDEHPGSRATLDLLAQKLGQLTPDGGPTMHGDVTQTVHDDAPEAPQSNATNPAQDGKAAPAASGVTPTTHPTASAQLAIPANVASEQSARATLGVALGALNKVADFFVGTKANQLLGHHLRHTVSLLEDASFGERPQPLRQLIEQARAVSSRESLEQGCTILQEALRSAGTSEERFQLRLALADLCTENSAPILAHPILKDLQEEIKKPVNEWLPHLEVELARATLECYQAADGKEGIPSQLQNEVDRESEDVMTLLSRLAPNIAARLRK